MRDKFPCFVVVPQAPGSWIEHAVFDKPIPLSPKPTSALALTVELVESTAKKDPVDPDRIYLLGYSNGACGVWDLLERLPRSWAAAVPMAGAGDPSHIAAAKNVPIWAFYGSKDPTIPIERMHEMESALHAAGGHPLYTVVKDGVHYDAKAKALADPSLLPCMLRNAGVGPPSPSRKRPARRRSFPQVFRTKSNSPAELIAAQRIYLSGPARMGSEAPAPRRSVLTPPNRFAKRIAGNSAAAYSAFATPMLAARLSTSQKTAATGADPVSS